MSLVTTLTLDDALSEVSGLIAGLNYRQALERCSELATFYPDAIRLLRTRAHAYELSGDMARAIDDYRRILEITPADARAMVGLARCQAKAGQYAESTLNAQQALAFVPNDPDALRIVGDLAGGSADGRLTVARSWFMGGLTNRAFAAVRNMNANEPDRADVQIVLAEMLWRSGLKIVTIELCQSILDAQPDCLNAHVILATLWALIGSIDTARLHQTAVEHLDPDFRATREWLGDQSPFAVLDVPAVPPPVPNQQTELPLIQDLDGELDRSAWVNELIAAASPVAPIAPAGDAATPPLSSENDVHEPSDADTETIADADGERIGTTPLEWRPVHEDDDMPAWLTVLRTEKTAPVAPETTGANGFDEPFERIDGTTGQTHNLEPRPVTVTKWSPEPPPVVTVNLAPPAGAAPVPTVPMDAPETAPATGSDESRLPVPASATEPAMPPAPDLSVSTPVPPARKRIRKGTGTKSAKRSTEELLELAHTALESGDYEGAADHYTTLVNAGKKMDVLLSELDTAAQTYPQVQRFHTLLDDIVKRKNEVNMRD